MLGSDLLGSSQALKSVTSSYNDSIMAVMTGMHTSCTCSKNYYNNFTIAKEVKQSTQSSRPSAGLEIATDMVANATNIFSLATKNSGLVAKVATRF